MTKLSIIFLFSIQISTALSLKAELLPENEIRLYVNSNSSGDFYMHVCLLRFPNSSVYLCVGGSHFESAIQSPVAPRLITSNGQSVFLRSAVKDVAHPEIKQDYWVAWRLHTEWVPYEFAECLNDASIYFNNQEFDELAIGTTVFSNPRPALKTAPYARNSFAIGEIANIGMIDSHPLFSQSQHQIGIIRGNNNILLHGLPVFTADQNGCLRWFGLLAGASDRNFENVQLITIHATAILKAIGQDATPSRYGMYLPDRLKIKEIKGFRRRMFN